jgi:hypothetical protein
MALIRARGPRVYSDEGHPGTAARPASACQRGSGRLGRASPIARAGTVAARPEPRWFSPAVPSAPFPARRLRFLTVNHGHLRSTDLQAPYYRCVATRMVRMGSPVRFRRGAPPQTSSPGRVLYPAPCMPGEFRAAVCQRFASRSPTVVVRALFESTFLSGLRSSRLEAARRGQPFSAPSWATDESERTRLCNDGFL